MGKYFLIALVLVILIGGGYFIFKGQNSAQPQPSTSTQNTQQSPQPTSMKSQPSTATASGNAVSYTANGFEPHSLTIKAGQTVTWTDKDSDDLWVASNPHPTHTDYPGFDELKSM